jgi:hypothetical protein
VRVGPSLHVASWALAVCLGPMAVMALTVATISAQSATRATRSAAKGFLAVDIFGGTHPQSSTSDDPNPPAATFGWEMAATVRPLRWLGVSAAVGRVRTPERAWIDHVQVGPRVSTALGRISEVRGFAHVLLGRAKSRLPEGTAAESLELMGGAGVDIFNVFRFQVDLVKRDLPAFPRTDGRFLFGVAVPLCFRGCGPSDGFKVR